MSLLPSRHRCAAARAALLALAGLVFAGSCGAQASAPRGGHQAPAPEPRKERDETSRSAETGAVLAVGAVAAALLLKAANKRNAELQGERDAALKARDDARRALSDYRAEEQIYRTRVDQFVQARKLELDHERGAREVAERDMRAARTASDNLQTQLNQARSEANTRVRQAQAATTAAQSETQRERDLRAAAEAANAGATQRIEQLERGVATVEAQRGAWAAAAGALGLALGGMLVRALWPRKLPVEIAVATPMTVQISAGAWSIGASALPREAHAGFRLRAAWLPIASSVQPARSLVREVLRGPTRSAYS